MTRLGAALLMMAAVGLGGCGNGAGAGPNPPQLWIASNGDELHVKLQPIMPNPF
jgi:hypothetical protein